jgi:hypothetical protein
VGLNFFSLEDGTNLFRVCAPIDYGPSRRSNDKSDRYHFFDFDGDEGMHPLSILPWQIASIEVLSETFDPAEFVTCRPIVWFFTRDWGAYSGSLAA